MKRKSLLTEVLVIRLERQYVECMRKIAREKGLGVSVLARMWLMEKLQEDLSRKQKLAKSS